MNITSLLKGLFQMERFFLFFILLLVVSNLHAQVDLSVNYNSTHSGYSVLIMGSKRINKDYEFGGGLRYNINRKKQSDDQNNVFCKRLYATKIYQHLGVDVHVNRFIFKKWEKIEPYIFYDIQLAYSTTRNRFFNPIGQTEYGNFVYEESITSFGPFLWMENHVGIGYKVDLFKSFFLTQRLGVGVDLIFGNDKYLSTMAHQSFTWEFGGLANLGIGYRF